MAPIGKQIVWDINDVTKNLGMEPALVTRTVIDLLSFTDIQGNFSFYKMTEITNGTTCGANYDEDRIIFYNTTTKTPLGVVSVSDTFV